jgi:uncharacterized protein (DUF697 family)
MEKKTETSKRTEAVKIIDRHMYWAIGAGLIPIPIADIAAVTAIQTDMLKSICEVYHIDFSKDKGKTWIGALVGATLTSALARVGASAVKTIPVIGTAAGMTSMAVLSGATTYAIGHVFVNHFEAGGTASSFNIDDVKKFYKEKLAEGKKKAAEWKKKYSGYLKSKKGKENSKNITEKLTEIHNLKSKNLISEEEFNTMRNDILKSFVDGH